MRKATIVTLILIYSSLLCIKSFALNNQTVTTQNIVVGLITFPPFIQKEGNDKCYGSAIDDLQKIFSEHLYTLTFYCAPPSRIYRDFNQGLIDITINVKSTESLRANIIYSQKYYEVLEVVLYSKESKQNQKVASIRSYNYHGTRQKLEFEGYEFVDVANTKEAIAVFLRGGTDSLLSYRQPFEHYFNDGAKKRRYAAFNVSFTQKSFISVPSYFAVNTKNRKAQEIVDKIDAYFSR
ncbi:MAG: polar amino acid transport system substrate-binding protein [Alphaproteobacteria bacterium]|jgi:polar amino acid transport system substrate-binding protein